MQNTMNAITLLTKLRTIFEANCDLNLTFTDLKIIELIKENCNITMTEIAKNLNISKSAVSQKIAKLEKKQYLKRVIDINNKKKINLELTKSLEEDFSLSKKHLDSYINQVKNNMGKEKLENLKKLLNELLYVIENIFEKEEGKYYA